MADNTSVDLACVAGDNPVQAAYVFVRSGKAWSQQAELPAPERILRTDCGCSVALSGKTALAGADGKCSFTGGAYIFVRSGGLGHSSQR